MLTFNTRRTDYGLCEVGRDEIDSILLDGMTDICDTITLLRHTLKKDEGFCVRDNGTEYYIDKEDLDKVVKIFELIEIASCGYTEDAE